MVELTHPWIKGDLKIAVDVLAAIKDDALRCYPSESCGYLRGPVGRPHLINEILVEKNEADKYHQLDPKRFPRDSTTYFKMNELRAARLFESSSAEGRPIQSDLPLTLRGGRIFFRRRCTHIFTRRRFDVARCVYRDKCICPRRKT